MSKRLTYYIRYMYACAGIFYFVPVKYKFKKGLPDILVPVKSPRMYQMFGIIATFIVGLFIIYLYYEACFGQTTRLEKMFTIGINCIFNMMHASQSQILVSSRRRNGLNVTNAALATTFRNCKSPMSFEMLCSLLCSSSLIC